MDKVPKQIEPGYHLIRSWTTNYPLFYGIRTTNEFVQSLLNTERLLNEDCEHNNIDPITCRVLAAYHGPKGAKVPLSLSTISGCVRPEFISINKNLNPSGMSCYDGDCYLFHSRAIPAKQSHEIKVRAHITPVKGLLAAAKLSQLFGVSIRDNQSSDGSLSMTLRIKGKAETQLYQNLALLNDSGFKNVQYLCFSSSYVKVPNSTLQSLSIFPNLVVHVTLSGWHSVQENILRLNEFERYKSYLPNVCLRLVNRKDWYQNINNDVGNPARCESWLLVCLR
jgi:hypothetical protein